MLSTAFFDAYTWNMPCICHADASDTLSLRTRKVRQWLHTGVQDVQRLQSLFQRSRATDRISIADVMVYTLNQVCSRRKQAGVVKLASLQII